jgi:DNA invertase Pin-like site-specific DNA recombinase
MAHVLATFAQFERRLISQRTREALAVKRAQGVRLGRPSNVDPATVRRIRRARQNGKSFAAIAERLNQDAVPTAHGGVQWYPATVRAVLNAKGRSPDS